MAKNLQTLVDQLDAIAKKNNEEFSYCVEITKTKYGYGYLFICKEIANDHDFITGDGRTIDEAVTNAAHEILGALSRWGYEYA